VDLVHIMLKEIYKWFVENLKHTAMAPSTARAQPAPLGVTFGVYERDSANEETRLLCPQASFHPKWLDGESGSGGSRLFQCWCELDNLKVHEGQLQFLRMAFPPQLH
jgi:hypothetical protein